MTRTLRPGLVVARRDDGHLQVGLDAPRRVVLPDTPQVRRVLDAVARGEEPEGGPATARVLVALERTGCLVAAGRSSRSAGLPPATVESARARHGDDAARRLAARAATLVSIDAPATLVGQVEPLLRAAGLRTPGARGAGQPTVHLALTTGVLARERLDDCLRLGRPHLVVSGHEGALTVGPFVDPGRTGCLRCADAARSETDPRRAVVLEQLASTPPPAGDPVLLALALAWAVRDLVAWAEGDRPSTWGAAYELGGPTPHRLPVDLHPHCGCGWAALGAAAGA